MTERNEETDRQKMHPAKALLILLSVLFGLPLVALVFLKYLVALWNWLAPLG